jgi:DNA-binding CsgD family transcriptional regulator
MRSNDFLIEIQKAKRKRKRKKSKAKRSSAYFYPYYGFGSTDSTSDGGGGDGGGLAEMSARALSDEQVKEIAEFWANGETFGELARMYKVGTSSIRRNLLRVFGEKKFDELEQQHLANTKYPERRGPKGITPEQVQQMAKLFASGITPNEIGRRFRLNRDNVIGRLSTLPNYKELEQQHLANRKFPERGINKGITPEQAKEIYDLYIAGDKTIRAIGDEFNITDQPLLFHVSNIAKQLYGPDGFNKVRQERIAKIKDRKRLGPTTIRRTDTLVGPSREGPTRKRRGFKGPVSGGSGLMEIARPRVCRLSDEQVKEIAEFWANGETFYELARVYKVGHMNTMKNNLLRVFGEKKFDELEQQHLANTKYPESGRKKGTTPEQVQQMAKLFASGITLGEIGRRFGVSRAIVYTHLTILPNYNELEQQHLANTKYPESGRSKGITPEQSKEIYDLYIAGDKTLAAIGDEFGIAGVNIRRHVSKIAKQLYGPDGYNQVKQIRKAKIKDRKRLGPTTIRRTDTLVGPSREGPTRKGRGFKGPVSGGSGLMENKQIVDKKSRQYTMNEVKKFKNWACQRLSIKNPPKITLSYNTKEAQTGHHTGKHIEGSDSVWVYVNNRNLVDILRTVFHELVHWRQSELGMIEHGDSYPGSAIEAMADMLAGKYIKIYGKDNQNIFQ